MKYSNVQWVLKQLRIMPVRSFRIADLLDYQVDDKRESSPVHNDEEQESLDVTGNQLSIKSEDDSTDRPLDIVTLKDQTSTADKHTIFKLNTVQTYCHQSEGEKNIYFNFW